LRKALAAGLKVDVVEVDSINVASVLNSCIPFRGAFSSLVDDIKALCGEAGVRNCQAVPQNENRLVHRLPSLALSSSEVLRWFNVSSSCIFPVGVGL